MKGLFQCPPRASPWVLKQIQKSRPERAKAFNIKAFALSGRLCFLSTLPRAMPWARGFCPFRAYGTKLAKVQLYNIYLGFY